MKRSTFWALLLVNPALLLVGVSTTFFWPQIAAAGLAVIFVVIGIFTFLTLANDSGDIRTALTTAFVFVYLAILGMSLNDFVAGQMNNPFPKLAYENLQTILGVIIGFYFGGKAFEKAAKVRARAAAREQPRP